MGRKLNFGEVMIVSNIFRAIEVKGYIDGLLLGYKLDGTKTLEDHQKFIGGQVITYMLQNMGQAQNEFNKLLQSYLGKTEEEINTLDIDVIFETVTDLFKNGLPSILTTMFKPSKKK